MRGNLPTHPRGRGFSLAFFFFFVDLSDQTRIWHSTVCAEQGRSCSSSSRASGSAPRVNFFGTAPVPQVTELSLCRLVLAAWFLWGLVLLWLGCLRVIHVA